MFVYILRSFTVVCFHITFPKAFSVSIPPHVIIFSILSTRPSPYLTLLLHYSLFPFIALHLSASSESPSSLVSSTKGGYSSLRWDRAPKSHISLEVLALSTALRMKIVGSCPCGSLLSSTLRSLPLSHCKLYSVAVTSHNCEEFGESFQLNSCLECV